MAYETQSEPVVLFAIPPLFEELCAMTVRVSNHVTFSQVASTWQPQIIKCREIIFTEPNVLATPTFDVENSFNIILKQAMFHTGKLQQRFQKIGLEASDAYDVSPALYQSCLKYTMTAKLAPSWNKAGEWMINGRNFLTHTGYSSAVKVSLLVNHNELMMSVQGTAVKFPPLQISDLDVGNIHMIDGNTTLDLTRHNCWCYILPSMKRGRICTVSTCVPSDCPFRSYQDLKRHWKNTYGYRLPDTDDDILYYQISFRQNGGKLFTYPNVCLRAKHMQQIPRIDPKPIILSYVKDIHSKLPSICKHPLKFTPKLRYVFPELYGSATDCSKLVPNISKVNPAARSSVPQRQFKDLSQLTNHSPASHLPSVSNTNCNNARKTSGSNSSLYDKSNSQITNTLNSTQIRPSTECLVEICAQKHDFRSQVSNVECTTGNVTSTQGLTVDRTIHASQTLFGDRTVYASQRRHGDRTIQSSQNPIGNRTNVSSQSLHEDRTVQSPQSLSVDCTVHASQSLHEDRTVQSPQSLSVDCTVHTSQVLVDDSSLLDLQSMLIQNKHSNISTIHLTSQKVVAGSNRIVPMFKPKAIKTVAPLTLSSITRNVPMFKPKAKSAHQLQLTSSIQPQLLSVTPTPELERIEGNVKNMPCVGKPMFTKNKSSFKNQKVGRIPQTLDTGLLLSKANLSYKIYETGTVAQTSTCTNVPSSSQNILEPGITTGEAHRVASSSSLQNSECLKRKSINDTEGQGKKARSKPQVQDVNVEALASAKQLSKVNTVTLLHWLRGRGVVCKARDKKSDLVIQVHHILNLQIPET